jgi:hypothetical protein
MSDFGLVCVRWADLFVSVALCASALRQCGRGRFPVHCNTTNDFHHGLTGNSPAATCTACLPAASLACSYRTGHQATLMCNMVQTVKPACRYTASAKLCAVKMSHIILTVAAWVHYSCSMPFDNRIISTGCRLTWQQQSVPQQACPCLFSQGTAVVCTRDSSCCWTHSRYTPECAY